MTPGRIRVGIGGWNFAPWRGTFFPRGLKHDDELPYAASRLTAIEVNGTFYRTQTPEVFRHWRDAVPTDFAFTLKAPRAAVQRRELGESGPAVTRFLESGVIELGDRLGPLLWQMAPTRKFDAATTAAFLALLPEHQDGVRLRHAIEAKHASFDDPAFAAMLAERNVARVFVDAEGHATTEPTADFVYARLKRNDVAAEEGYEPATLDHWAAQSKQWAAAGRDCFVYFIAGDKVRAPDAATAMLRRLS